MRMIVVGGVPGAGKTTLLSSYASQRTAVLVLDPDRFRTQLTWRPLVHAVHVSLVWCAVLRGPRTRALAIHETATRPLRRSALLWWGRARGWQVNMVLIDVSQLEALRGQHDRGRMVNPSSFSRHWRRWAKLRMRDDLPEEVVVVSRNEAAAVLDHWLSPERATLNAA